MVFILWLVQLAHKLKFENLYYNEYGFKSKQMIKRLLNNNYLGENSPIKIAYYGLRCPFSNLQIELIFHFLL